MISKNDTKRIQQLYQKKFRYKEGAFIAETPKVVEEFLRAGFERLYWFCTDRYETPSGISGKPVLIDERSMKAISRLESPSSVLAVFSIPVENEISNEGIILALDGVRDPGNMGTIIRLADWFGVRQVWLSEDCVDIWNPKVVQATMGSLTRIQPVVLDLLEGIDRFQSNGGSAFVADMNGDSHYDISWPSNTLLIMGNEGVGPRAEICRAAGKIVTIPRGNEKGPESLNVAMATGVLLAEINRP